MLNESKELAQKKSKTEKVVQEYNKKKEEEKIRKSVQSDKLEEFFEPVTKSVAAIPTTPAATPTTPASVPTAVGQLIDVDQPVPNIMDTPVPPAIQGPDEPDETPGPPSGLQVSEITKIPGGLSLDMYDAEKQLERTNLTIQEKIKQTNIMNQDLGKVKKKLNHQQKLILSWIKWRLSQEIKESNWKSFGD